ncbi:MAG TPA: 2'-5' RNA ligase family protein [Gammaproteobacteria bacterium]|nr:2'-5' RNA ligase family protein [Gammaproteobacteria bacterium]
MKKYNIALIPINEGKSIIQCAKNFSSIAGQYLLGEKSLPHVTLYQFMVDESDIDNIWEKVFQSLEQHSIYLTFEKFSCITFDEHVFWASLLPNHCDNLIKMHSSVSNTINKPIKSNYDPHMTLINTKNKEYENLVNEFSKSYIPIQDTFVLSLGESDDIGQFTKLLYSYQLHSKKSALLRNSVNIRARARVRARARLFFSKN